MSAQLYCSVSTKLDRKRVWLHFSDLENWVEWSDVYEDLTWEGPAWVSNASIVGRVRHNRNEKIRYVMEKCDPARLVSYVGHSYESGFASHRTVRFQDLLEGGTLIAIILITLVLVVVVLVLALPHLIDVNQYRGQIQAQLQQRLNRPVQLKSATTVWAAANLHLLVRGL